MLKLLLICLLSLTVVLADDPYPYAEENHVINIGEPTWEKAINEFPQGFLMYYYEEYCLPCRQFFPKYVQAAINLFNANSNVRLGKVECHDEVKLCNDKGVTSFPTLILHRAGQEPFEYRGPRTTEDLQAWIRHVVDFKYDTVNDQAALFKNFSTAILVRDSSAAVDQASRNLHDEVAIVKPGSKLPSQSAIAILTQTGEEISINEQATAEEIINNVKDVLHKRKLTFPNLNHETIAKLKGHDDYDVVLYFRGKGYNPFSDEVSAFEEAGQRFGARNLPFAFVNIANDIFGNSIAKYFGLTEESSPSVGIISKKGRILKKYLLKKEITTDNLVNFVNRYSRGEEDRYYMSAEVPQTKKGHYVRELVGKNYKEVTQDSNVNVLVMTYFPWCEWCVKLDPTWTSLAYRFRNRKDLIIAKIDVSQNDVEGIDATEHPILLFYPKGTGKKMIEYQSNRNVRDIQKFLIEKIPGLVQDIEL